MESFDFEILILETRGSFRSAGHVELLGRARAMFLPEASISEGRATVLARSQTDAAWTESSLLLLEADARDLSGSITRLGVQEREPAIEGIVDTADYWTNLKVQVTVGEFTRDIAVHAQASGFRGPDAGELRWLLRRVFAAAGYDSYDHVLYDGLDYPA